MSPENTAFENTAVAFFYFNRLYNDFNQYIVNQRLLRKEISRENLLTLAIMFYDHRFLTFPIDGSST